MDVHELAPKVSNRQDFINFVRALRDDFKAEPDTWQHVNIAAYLEAIASWTEDMYSYRAHVGDPMPEECSWRLFSETLLAAKYYE